MFCGFFHLSEILFPDSPFKVHFLLILLSGCTCMTLNAELIFVRAVLDLICQVVVLTWKLLQLNLRYLHIPCFTIFLMHSFTLTLKRPFKLSFIPTTKSYPPSQTHLGQAIKRSYLFDHSILLCCSLSYKKAHLPSKISSVLTHFLIGKFTIGSNKRVTPR